MARHLVLKAASGDDPTDFTAAERELYNRIRSALSAAGRNADTEALARAIQSLDPAELEATLTALQVSGLEAYFTEAIRAVLVTAGVTTAGQIAPVIAATPDWQGVLTGKPKVRFKFDVTDPLATQMAQTQAARLITSMNESMRLSVRQVITRAFTEQTSAPYTARRLRNVIGLHPRWAIAVDRFHDRQIKSLTRDGVPLDRAMDRAQTLTDTYRARLIRARANMIARTEIQTAQNMGRQIAWSQSVAGGWVEGDSMKEWVATGRSASGIITCEECGGMDGKRVRWDRAFPNGVLMPPAHPNCRCSAVMIPPNRGLGDDAWIATGEQS